MSDPSIRLAVIFVLYRTYAEFEKFLASQSGCLDELFVIVVDNTPHAQCDRARLIRWQESYGISTVVAHPENLGYFGAAHYATRVFPELYNYDFVAISNTDVRFQLTDTIETLRRCAAGYRNVGAIAPRLTNRDGTPKAQRHYVGKPAPERYARLARISSHYYLAAAHRLGSDLKRAIASRNVRGCPRRIFAPHGAFMILTREYLAKTRGFDYPCFLFNEEIFVGLECEAAGLSCVYESMITYSHENHGSMGSFPSRVLISHLRDAHEFVAPLLGSEHDQAP